MTNKTPRQMVDWKIRDEVSLDGVGFEISISFKS